MMDRILIILHSNYFYYKFSIYSILFFLCSIETQAQQSINTMGCEGSGASGTMSYSIGQIDFIAINTSNEWLNLGVQQPYEILDTIQISDFSCNLFPNPTFGPLYIRTQDPGFLSYNIYIYDTLGRTVILQRDVNVSKSIKLDDFPEGIYFILLINNKNQDYKYKIIKITR